MVNQAIHQLIRRGPGSRIACVRFAKFVSPHRHIPSPMWHLYGATIDDTMHPSVRKLPAMTSRHMRKIRYHDLQGRRDRAIAQTVCTVAAGAEALIELSAVVGGQLFGAAAHRQQHQRGNRGHDDVEQHALRFHRDILASRERLPQRVEPGMEFRGCADTRTYAQMRIWA